MESGRPSRTARGRKLSFGAAALAVAFALFVLSCGDREAAFRAALGGLDAAFQASSEAPSWAGAFDRAVRRASGPKDWLSLLARARHADLSGDAGRYSSIAELALARVPASREVAMVAADAFIRDGKPERALALFAGRLSKEDEPGLWAEAVVKCLDRGVLPPDESTPQTWADLAAILEDPALYKDAALASLVGGDGLAAQYWLRKAIDLGLSPEAEMLWDSGMYAWLSRLPDAGAAAKDLRLMGDASWHEGDLASARSRWTRAVELDPRGSWRTWASLAALAGGRIRVNGDTGRLFDTRGNFRSEADEGASGSPSDAAALAESSRLYARMIALFPNDPGARIEYAAALVRAGRKPEAASFLPDETWKPGKAAQAVPLEPRLARARLIVGAAVWPETRLVPECLRATELFPGDAEMEDVVLSLLLERGYYDDFLVVFDEGSKRGLEWRDKPFHAALAALARGRDAEADTLLRGAGAAAGLPAAFASALLDEKRGDYPAARDTLVSALPLANDAATRAAVLKELGRVQDGLGDPRKADGYYAAAAEADPSDAEAVRLAHR